MIKFDKLSRHDMPFLIRRVTYCIILLVIIGGLSISLSILSTKSIELNEQVEDLNQLIDDENDLNLEINEMTELLSQIKVLTESEVVSKEDLVVILGDCAKAANVVFTGLSSRDISTMNSVTKYNFNFEVKGTATQLADFLKRLDEKQLHYAVNELSFRQEGDYLWLQRNFDEQITWWDLSNIVISGGYQSQVGISSQDIMSDDTMSLYLDIDFIFVKASEEDISSELSSNIEEVDYA